MYTFTKLHDRRIPNVGVRVGPVGFQLNYTRNFSDASRSESGSVIKIPRDVLLPAFVADYGSAASYTTRQRFHRDLRSLQNTNRKLRTKSHTSVVKRNHRRAASMTESARLTDHETCALGEQLRN